MFKLLRSARSTPATLALLVLAAALAGGCGPKDTDDEPIVLLDSGVGGETSADTGVGGDSGGADTGHGDDATAGAGDDGGQGGDTGPAGDAGPGEDAGDTGGDTGPSGPLDPLPSCVDSTPTAAGEPTEVDTGTWTSASANSSQIIADLAAGSFQVPQPFERAYGSLWNSVTPKDDGTVHGGGQRGVVYVAKNFQADEATTYFARGDRVYSIFVNGAKIPGDVYGRGNKRVPIHFEKGTNTVVLQIPGSRTGKFELFETPDALHFNTGDTTVPDLRVGHDTALPVGVPVLNLAGRVLRDVKATVVGNSHFKETTVEYPTLGANALTQLSWRLEPKKAWSKAGETIPVKLRLESCALQKAYETTIELKTVEASAKFRQTFRSPVDGSTQYYGVVPPENFTPMKNYGLVLSLHGAGVQAKGQANAYSPKDWAYIVAPTNRRRFGFDWEEWGRLNGLAALDDASARFSIDPTDVHVTGHSMGGHGTWHFGAMHPGKFATIGPSAGWASFYTYPPGRTSKPNEPVQSARAHSETLSYLQNVENRPIYFIHGTADRNVPIGQAKTILSELQKLFPNKMDIQTHWEEGAKHWWNGDRSKGTDCVDWPPLFELMKKTKLDPHELDFSFKTPGPYYSPSHSYVTIQSRNSPLKDALLESSRLDMKTVELKTTNVRSMLIDGKALSAKGIESLKVDGSTEMVVDGEMTVGPQTGKTPEQSGPFNQVFQKPFCFVYSNAGPAAYRDLAAQLLTTWNLRGNGHGCALPLSLVDQEVRDARNLVYLGVPFDKLQNKAALPFNRSGGTINIGDLSYRDALSIVTYPEGDGLAAHIAAPRGQEQLVKLLFASFQPFSSRAGMPDFLVFDINNGQFGAAAIGFFGPDWSYNSNFAGSR